MKKLSVNSFLWLRPRDRPVLKGEGMSQYLTWYNQEKPRGEGAPEPIARM
jgi:hypothetical protein